MSYDFHDYRIARFLKCLKFSLIACGDTGQVRQLSVREARDKLPRGMETIVNVVLIPQYFRYFTKIVFATSHCN